ncbi:MAG: 16S rRNA (cytosine(1402)-N(4))-methyltransferase [Methylomonas sp.]|nr:MAG: 16S rRNA (cytosine(1402)-N(4))-methyltransferase [Methylomonas sp.]
MKRITLAETTHFIIKEHLQAGDIAIDATLGNGHDCLFLAECVGSTGHVYGFDIQTQALESTRQRLHDLNAAPVTLIRANHADMRHYIPEAEQGHISAIMFNLGYLPGTDKSIMTQTQTTLQAIEVACDLLASQGLVTVMAYPGHAGGDEETRSLQAWVQNVEFKRFSVETHFSQHHQESAPRLFVIRKLT